MKIAIYNLEPKYINIALEKIKLYHQSKGDEVDNYKKLWHHTYDKIYCSSIFTFTNKQDVTKDMMCGGSGFDLRSRLPLKIEKMKPKINIGFTSRGCNRNCSFCIVRRKEGSFKIVGDIYDFWNGCTQIISILDNNILFNKKHFIKICRQTTKENIKVTFSQGLDIRLIDRDICRWLTEIKHHNKIKFAWDNYKDKKIILDKLEFLLDSGVKASKIMIYVLCGYDTTFKEDMERSKILKSLKVDPFIMRYYKKSKLLNEFARWNNIYFFRNIPFEDYLRARKYLYLLNQKT